MTLPEPLPANDRRWLIASMVFYAVLLLVFYPLMYTSVDEASTFGFTYVLRHGTIFPGRTPYYSMTEFYPELSPFSPNGRVYRFPIGFPAVLALIAGAGWRTFFLVNPALHLAATWCFARLLQVCRVSPRYALLYLLFPGFILFTRTLFSDAFAASLTTIALYFIFCRRSMLLAGVCLGIALTSRTVSWFVTAVLLLGLLVNDYRDRDRVPFWQGQGAKLLLTLLPFIVVNLIYNYFTTGSFLHSTYTSDALSWNGLKANGPIYFLSLLFVYPGMLLAPFLYRGKFWREGFICTVVVCLAAASYSGSTYGNNLLQTLLSKPRQVLPVMPFFLLAYCSIVSHALRDRLPGLLRLRLEALAAVGLACVAIGIAASHQKYLRSLREIHTEIVQTVPVNAVIYANKDSYKLYQLDWDHHLYRELPSISSDQCRHDLTHGPVYVVLYSRSRGFTGEDQVNARINQDVQARFITENVAAHGSGQVRYFRVLSIRGS